MSALPIKAISILCAVLMASGVGVMVLAVARNKATRNPEIWSSTIDTKEERIVPIDTIPRIHIQFSDSQRYGLVCTRLRDPRNPEQPKLLTRDERGLTNNTCVRIEGYEYLFGHEIPGVRWVREKNQVQKEVPMANAKGRGWQSTMEFTHTRTRVTQSVELVIGEQTRLYDTALVRYHIVNNDKVPHTIGVRVLLDTFIGANDGVPFYVPPSEHYPAHLIDKLEVFDQKRIPDYLQALETGDLKDGNATVAVLCPKIRDCEPLEKLVVCRWPQNSEARWGGGLGHGNWPYEPMDLNPHAKDSCVALYWAQVTMAPGEQRNLAFTYGLGMMGHDRSGSTVSSGRMRLFVANRALVDKPFPVTVYIKSTDSLQKVTLQLPEGLSLVPGQTAEQSVPTAGALGYSQVTWRVKAAKRGTYQVSAEAPNIGVVRDQVIVREKSLFD